MASPVPVAAPAPVLRILLPAQGAHTGTAVLVRVALRRAPARARLRYSVDHGHAQPAGLRFTLHDLVAGRHRLVVTLLGTREVHASVTFFVHPPPPAPAPPPTTTTPATTTTTVAPPPPPPPTTTTTTTAPPPNKIPQNNGGDGDADNNGAPSDGDGNF